MSTKDRQLNFDTLLRHALQEWPGKLTLNLTRTNIGTVNERYIVNDLGIMEEEISGKYINTPDEVLMVNLHTSIFATIHALALFCTQVELKNIRNSEIKQRFEKRLVRALEIEDLGWSSEDKLLIDNYFRLNKLK